MKKIPFEFDFFNSSKVRKSGFDENINSFGYSDLTNSYKNKLDTFNISESQKLWNLTAFVCLILVVGIIFILKAFNLQIILGEKYLSLSHANNTRYAQIQADRGVIYDRNGEVLTRNKPAFSIEMNTMYCAQLNVCDITIHQIESLLNKSLPEAYLAAKNRKQVIIIDKGLQKEAVIPIENKLATLPGVVVTVQPLRDYLYPTSFAHVLGYVGLDEKSLQPIYVGKAGIEKTYDTYIRGLPGEKIIQVDSTGQSYKTVAEQSPLPGKNIHTYLDMRIQNAAFALLKQKVDDHKATAGVVVAQDPKTGGVIAMVSYPSFDSNKISYGMSDKEMDDLLAAGNYPFFNRAISGAYPPGSTFKLVTASAALEERVINEHTIIFDPGYLQVGAYIFKNWKPGGHGDVNLVKALQVSNDTYFYTVGGGHNDIKGLGIAKLSAWAKKFGYGSLTGVDMEGEVSGNMPNGQDRDWYLGDTFITAIGQGDVLSTPLQVNNATTYFANGGYLIKPKIVKSIDGVGDLPNVILAQSLVNPNNYELVREGMKAVAAPGGTAYPLFDFPQKHNGIELAAKTGTSEFKDAKGEDKTHAWLTVFGPYKDTSIVLTVFLEGGGAGSDDASPIARQLMDIWFK